MTPRAASPRPGKGQSLADIHELEAANAELHWRAARAEAIAERLWVLLHSRCGIELEDVVGNDPDDLAVADPAWRVARRLYEREHIHVEPCRRILPWQDRRYTLVYPGGEQRTVTRDQLVMMGGGA